MSGGRLVELDELDSFVGQLPSSSAPLVEFWSWPIWHSWWIFGIAVACLCVDWTMRRRAGFAMTRVHLLPIVILLSVGFFRPSHIAFAHTDEVPSDAAAETAVEPAIAGSNTDEAKSAPQALIVVVGSGGTAEYTAEFSKWANRWTDAAKKAEIQCVLIGGDQGAKAGEATVAAADLKSVPSDADLLGAAIHRLALLETSEPLWLVYLGHGTFDGRRAALNLRGTDVTDEQLAKHLTESKRPIVGVFCSSCSSPFVNALSGAQSSHYQRNEGWQSGSVLPIRRCVLDGDRNSRSGHQSRQPGVITGSVAIRFASNGRVLFVRRTTGE